MTKRGDIIDYEDPESGDTFPMIVVDVNSEDGTVSGTVFGYGAVLTAVNVPGKPADDPEPETAPEAPKPSPSPNPSPETGVNL